MDDQPADEFDPDAVHLLKFEFESPDHAESYSTASLERLLDRHEEALEILGVAEEDVGAAREESPDAEEAQRLFTVEEGLETFALHHRQQAALIREVLAGRGELRSEGAGG